MQENPKVQAWVNNSAVVLLSGLFSLGITIFAGGMQRGAIDAQIKINTARLDYIERFGSPAAREEIIKLHDTDFAVDRHLQDIDRRLGQLEEENRQQADQISELRRITAKLIK